MVVNEFEEGNSSLFKDEQSFVENPKTSDCIAGSPKIILSSGCLAFVEDLWRTGAGTYGVGLHFRSQNVASGERKSRYRNIKYNLKEVSSEIDRT
jgi:hypothetical protein